MDEGRTSLLGKVDFDRTVEALAREFVGMHGRETIARFVQEALDRWPHATVSDHLPLLAHRFSRERLRALGLDMSRSYPKPLTDEFVRASDVVITMGCGDACPIYPGKRYEDWELEDPADKDLETVRRIRDEIDARVRALVDDLRPQE